jgi:hypothetical protein
VCDNQLSYKAVQPCACDTRQQSSHVTSSAALPLQLLLIKERQDGSHDQLLSELAVVLAMLLPPEHVTIGTTPGGK